MWKSASPKVDVISLPNLLGARRRVVDHFAAFRHEQLRIRQARCSNSAPIGE